MNGSSFHVSHGRDVVRHEERGRRRFDGRRHGLLSGTWIVFQDAPLAAVTRAVVTLSAGAATGPLLVLATERFVATALEVAGGQLAMAAITVPVIALAALFAVEILETVVRSLADSRIEAGLRRGFRADLTEKRARLEYRYIESQETWDLLRRVAAGPQVESRPAPERGPVKAGIRRRDRSGSHRRAGGRHRGRAGSAGVVDPPFRGGAHGPVRAARNPGRAPSLRVRAPRGEPATPRRVPVGRGPAGEGSRRGAGTVRMCRLRERTVACRVRRGRQGERAGESP